MSRRSILGAMIVALALAGGCGGDDDDEGVRFESPPEERAPVGTEATRPGRECGDLVDGSRRRAATDIVASGADCSVALEVARPAEDGRDSYRARGFACTSTSVPESVERIERRYTCVGRSEDVRVTFNLRASG